MSAPSMTVAELEALPVSVDLATAGRALGMGRTKAHTLARAGEFPIKVHRLGGRYMVVRSDLLRIIGTSWNPAQRNAEEAVIAARAARDSAAAALEAAKSVLADRQARLDAAIAARDTAQ